MNKMDVVKAWKKNHLPDVGKMARSEPVRILPGYRLDFGDRTQLRLNFDGVEVREASTTASVMYRRWM